MAPIAASVAASVAATLALKAGMAFARAERGRRQTERHRRAHRQFALLPAETASDGLRRIALGQLDLAIELLAGNGLGAPDEKAVHDTRKALKRLRALMRLLRGELGEDAFQRENIALRDTGRRLSAARDAEVMVLTLDNLLESHPRELGRRADVRRLREHLVGERRAAAARTLGDGAALRRALGDLVAVRGRALGWRLHDPAGIALAEEGLERVYAQGRRRYRRAASGKGDRGRALHEWRKRVKDLRHAAEMLDRADPAGSRRARKRKVKARAHAQRLGTLAKRADALGEMLGEEHDLAVLAARLRSRESKRHDPLSRRGRKRLLKSIEKRRRKLRKRALRDGERIYKRGPGSFTHRMRDAFDASAAAAAGLTRR